MILSLNIKLKDYINNFDELQTTETINKSLKALYDSLNKKKLIESELLDIIEKDTQFIYDELQKSNVSESFSNIFKPYLDLIESAISNHKKQYADGIIYNNEGKILMLLRTGKDDNKELDNKWGLPGGHIDEGETPQQAVVREILEETNLVVESVNLRYADEKDKCIIHFFTCHVDPDQLYVLNAHEHTNFKWVNKAELQELDCIYDLKEKLNQLVFNIESINKSYKDELNIDFDDIIEKGDWKNHKYLRKEGEKYIYADETNKEYSIEDVDKQLEEVKRKKDEITKNVKFSLDASLTMPQELVDSINSWNEIHKSPYGDSFYDSGDKSWDYTRPGSLRVADHWNFYSHGKYHCQTDKDVENNKTWVIAKYNDKAKKLFTRVDKTGTKAYYHDANEDQVISENNKFYIKESEPKEEVKLLLNSDGDQQYEGRYEVIKEFPKDFDKQKRYYELSQELNELTNHKKAIERGFSSYDKMIDDDNKNASKIVRNEKKRQKALIDAGKVKASLTKKEYSKRAGRFILESENTYTGTVIKMSPFMVTIRTDDGKEFKGKDFHILEEKQEEIKMPERALEIIKKAFDDNQITDIQYFDALKKAKEIKKAKESTRIGDQKEWHGRKFKFTTSGWSHADDKASALKTEKGKEKLKIQDFDDKELEAHAERSSVSDLQAVIKDGRNPKLREIAMKHLATRKAKENEHSLHDLMILEETGDEHTYSKDKNCIHFDDQPDDDIIEKLNKHGIKYLIHSKEVSDENSKDKSKGKKADK